jgi:U4/U6.U5 tri-snRNP-associated protein 2
LIAVCRQGYLIQSVALTLDTEIKTTTSPFLFLSVDLPPPPLFQDSVQKNIIPQVSLASVLSKYDGKTAQVGITP